MVSRRLIKIIESNAHKLAKDLVASLRQDPLLPAYRTLSDEQYEGVIADLYGHLGQWLTSRTWHRLKVTYERKGRERFQGGLPLEQLVRSLIRTKQHLVDFVRGTLPGQADERDLELALIVSISEFFDKAVYHTIAGYEDSRRSTEHPREGVSLEALAASAGRATSDLRMVEGLERELPHVSRGGDIGEVSG